MLRNFDILSRLGFCCLDLKYLGMDLLQLFSRQHLVVKLRVESKLDQVRQLFVCYACVLVKHQTSRTDVKATILQDQSRFQLGICLSALKTLLFNIQDKCRHRQTFKMQFLVVYVEEIESRIWEMCLTHWKA
jgi:hypothetical protein